MQHVMNSLDEALPPCPACGELKPFEERFFRQGFAILECHGCGLGKTAIDADFDPQSYYTKDYFDGTYSDGYFDYKSSESVLRIEFSKTLQKIKKKTGIVSGHLLEVGCAYGFFLEEAQKYFDVHGVEIAVDAVTACHERGLHSVHQGEADESTLTHLGSFDLVVMLDVIEHLAQPHEVLARLARRINPGGALILTTGDFQSVAARVMGPRWRLLTPPQHLWFFSPISIRKMAEKSGLEFIHLSHPAKLVPFSLILFQFLRMLRMRLPTLPPIFSRLGVPVNLFDAMFVVLRKPAS
jgi:predicted TPR repeat methyltransferase